MNTYSVRVQASTRVASTIVEDRYTGATYAQAIAKACAAARLALGGKGRTKVLFCKKIGD